MPVTFGELSTLTTPLSMARLCAVVCSCLTFSMVSFVRDCITEQNRAFYNFCMVTWCVFFIFTFLVVVICFIQFHNLLPLSWKNLTASVAALGGLMTFSASIAFIWIILKTNKNCNAKWIAAAIGSCLTSLAYITELFLIRSHSDGHQRGYMASVPGLLKLLQVFGGCLALVLLSIDSNPHWRINVKAVSYSICLIPSIGTVLVMVLDCAARSPVPFDRLLASFSLLGVLVYTVGTVICFTQALEQDANSFIMSETAMASITLLAYTVDLAFSVKLLCDRN